MAGSRHSRDKRNTHLLWFLPWFPALVLVLFCGLEYYVYICDVKVLMGLIGALNGVDWG